MGFHRFYERLARRVLTRAKGTDCLFNGVLLVCELRDCLLDQLTIGLRCTRAKRGSSGQTHVIIVSELPLCDGSAIAKLAASPAPAKSPDRTGQDRKGQDRT